MRKEGVCHAKAGHIDASLHCAVCLRQPLRPGPAADRVPSRAKDQSAAADVTAAAEPMAAEPAIAALTDTLGRPDALQASSRLPRDIAIAADDDRPRTGKQLDGEGIQAGSEATVSLKPLPGPGRGGHQSDGGVLPHARSARCRLSPQHQDGVA